MHVNGARCFDGFSTWIRTRCQSQHKSSLYVGQCLRFDSFTDDFTYIFFFLLIVVARYINVFVICSSAFVLQMHIYVLFYCVDSRIRKLLTIIFVLSQNPAHIYKLCMIQWPMFYYKKIIFYFSLRRDLLLLLFWFAFGVLIQLNGFCSAFFFYGQVFSIGTTNMAWFARFCWYDHIKAYQIDSCVACHVRKNAAVNEMYVFRTQMCRSTFNWA